ncbi:DUF6932 family protein [[Mycobacterium] zoologicum]|uniref:DUF6932 family protein n=1 Tax=[Mycobacterium] zoologicum TaxID=2872311 RepID=UPI001CDAF84F|nr:hypothetical protein [Mycolicibacter sp. MYC101]MEB3064372.1 hypothetical protein [Mycolicibacter sp. MYC101]
MIPELASGGALPPGRYRATGNQLHATFVEGRGQARADLWRDWRTATNLLGRHVHINAAWLYGPFLSAATTPEAVHCVYWAEDLELDKARLDDTARNLLRAFALPGEVRRIVGLKVDTQLAAWHCQPDLSARDDRYTQYAKDRGTMDDLLQRIASGPVGAGLGRANAWPQRGYMEVIVGDYT